MLLIKNGYIKPMVGADLENGCVLIDDNGKIAAVGADLEAPAGATVIDAEGRQVRTDGGPGGPCRRNGY